MTHFTVGRAALLDHRTMRLRWVLCSVCLCLPAALFASEEAYWGPELEPTYDGPVLVHNSQFRYSARDHLSFVTEEHLRASYLHLLPLRPVIDTWASRLGIHPRLLTALVDSLFSGSRVSGERSEVDAVVQVAIALAKTYNDQRSHPLAASRAVTAAADALSFELRLPAGLEKLRPEGTEPGTSPPPLYGYFQPPWPIGETWTGGGAHGNNHNALDFWGDWRPWGDPDVFDYWVTAMQAGTVRKWSSCSVSVVHDNGWVTGYYHLENVQHQDFDTVERNDVLANYADDEAQATCSGGWSSGPHVHMSLKYDGSALSVDEDNVDFTAFSHHAGPGDYNTNCNESWYDHDTRGQICPNSDHLLNNVPSSPDLFTDGFESGGTGAWSASTG